MAKRVRNKSQKQFKELKKNHVGLSIFIQILIFAVIVLLVGLILGYVVESSVKTRLVGEYEQLYAMTRIYDLSLEEGKDQEEIYKTLDYGGREYMILDAEGNILHQNGKNTCTLEGGVLQLYYENVTAYKDQDGSVLSLYKDGSVDIDVDTVVNDVVNNWLVLIRESWDKGNRESFAEGVETEFTVEDGFRDEDDEEDGLSEGIHSSIYLQRSQKIKEWENRMYSYPLWFSLPLQDGGKAYVGKVYYRLNEEDSILLFAVFIILAVLAVLVLILKITNLIRDFLRQRRVVNLYLTDPVTKGHNWMYFLLRGEPYLRIGMNKNKNFAIVEILFVKYRNFCICHNLEEGQRILEELYRVIAKSISRKEMCAHVSTDTFAILLKYEDEEELGGRLKKLLESLENIDGVHKFAFHFGVRLLPVQRNENGKPVRRKELLLEKEYNNASSATATLEESDDSRIAYFDDKMLEEQKWLDAVQEHQKAAVEKEEFKVYYQPKYDPKTQKLCGAEALIRWDSPELGFVSPGKFIPIFEKNGFITEIDHYMISHVARDQKRWLDEGLACVPVSVNVSRAHFIEKDLASQICHMVDEAGAPHHLIEIELTESAFFDDKNAMINTILKLKEFGFAVSMDDFGSGYSSLNSLKDMPLDVLKLDAEFFRGQNAGERGEKVVSEAIKLAQSLNMRTVAEGVEEKEQVEFLARNGCDMIQGYYFAKPMPQGDYEERMRLGYALKNEEGAEEIGTQGDAAEAAETQDEADMAGDMAEATESDDTVMAEVIETQDDADKAKTEVIETQDDADMAEDMAEATGTDDTAVTEVIEIQDDAVKAKAAGTENDAVKAGVMEAKVMPVKSEAAEIERSVVDCDTAKLEKQSSDTDIVTDEKKETV